MPWTCSIVENHIHAKGPGHLWRADNDHWLVLLPGGCVHDIHGHIHNHVSKDESDENTV
jgi:hypothetical protein